MHLDELINSVGLSILWPVHKDGLEDGLDVVLNTVHNYVVDVANELVELGEALANMNKVPIDVHRSLRKSYQTRVQLVLKVLHVRHQDRLGVGTDLFDNAVVLAHDRV